MVLDSSIFPSKNSGPPRSWAPDLGAQVKGGLASRLSTIPVAATASSSQAKARPKGLGAPKPSPPDGPGYNPNKRGQGAFSRPRPGSPSASHLYRRDYVTLNNYLRLNDNYWNFIFILVIAFLLISKPSFKNPQTPLDPRFWPGLGLALEPGVRRLAQLNPIQVKTDPSYS
jgi:hypothetical protein